MEDRFYIRPSNDDQIAQFVHEWQRNGLLKLKRESESRGLTVKEMMVADGHWDSFVEDCLKDGDDPETEAAGLQDMVRNVR
jgi:hypothetical protein